MADDAVAEGGYEEQKEGVEPEESFEESFDNLEEEDIFGEEDDNEDEEYLDSREQAVASAAADAVANAGGARTGGGVRSTIKKMIKWKSSTTANVLVPSCGGICRMVNKDGKEDLVPWVGTDPDEKVNCFGWDIDAQEWSIDSNLYNKHWRDMQGPVHVGQYRPPGVKPEQATEEKCTKFEGVKFGGIKTKTDGDFKGANSSQSRQWDRGRSTSNGSHEQQLMLEVASKCGWLKLRLS